MNRTLLYVFFTMLISSPLFGGPGGHHMKGKHFNHVIEKLDLSDEQRQQIKDIRQKARPEMKALRQAFHQQKEQFHQLLKESNDDSALLSAFDGIEQAKSKLAKLRFTSMLAIRKVLTDDQRLKFHELKEERHKKHQDRKHQRQQSQKQGQSDD